jgi:hypothetical protein
MASSRPLALQKFLDRAGAVADLINGALQGAALDTEFCGPVLDFVIFTHGDPGAVGFAGLGLVV